MTRVVTVICLWLGTAGAFALAQAPDRVDLKAIAAIREEGLRRSQVMDHVSWLADVYGPRVSGTPAFSQASEWTMRKMREWGLVNVHQERFAFGRGWSLVRFNAHMTEPQVQPLVGFPKAWSPSTAGPVSAEVVHLRATTAGELENYRGKLRGKIVLTQAAREVRLLDGRVVLRMTADDEAEALRMPPPPAAPPSRPTERPFSQVLEEFMKAEGVVAAFDRGSDDLTFAGGSDLSWQTPRTDGGTVFPGTSPGRDPKAAVGVPSVTLAVEHYNRMVRILEKGLTVRVTLDLETRYHEEGEGAPNGINTLGELAGTDLSDEVVLLGAHLDSTHGSTGATDNATGVAAMLEAVRILKALGLTPRRTIRVGLWGGEEQGLLGSRAYVRQHLGDRETMALTPAHGKIAAVFNLDNGTGRIRGIWMQSNPLVQPIFQRWIDPLEDLGVTLLGPRSVSSTDHVPFDDLGIPAFQFIQERLEYNSRTHHSTMDFFDRVQRDDVTQMATVVAVFAYQAATRDGLLPRRPLPSPRQPAGSGGGGRP